MITHIEFTYVDEDGLEHAEQLPAKFGVCPLCEGHGTHLHRAIGEHAYTMEEFHESFYDKEDRSEYFRRGGRYDVQCEECHGQRVVPVLDEDALQQTDEGRQLLQAYHSHLEDEADYRRECEAERRMGC